jgi:hypothetical protein
MTKLMEEAIGLLRNVPLELQDELAQVIIELTGRETQLYELTPEEDADIAASEAAAARGEFATDEQIEAIWAKHGL